MTPREFGDRAFDMAFTVMDSFKRPGDGMGIGGNGAGECRTRPDDATLFNSIDYLKQQWTRYDGPPYYCRIKPDSLRIFKLTATEVVDAGD